MVGMNKKSTKKDNKMLDGISLNIKKRYGG